MGFTGKILITTLTLLIVTGCSNKQLYDNFKPKYDDQYCREQTEMDFETCRIQQAKDYEEYERERQELLKKK